MKAWKINIPVSSSTCPHKAEYEGKIKCLFDDPEMRIEDLNECKIENCKLYEGK